MRSTGRSFGKALPPQQLTYRVIKGE